MTVSTFSATKLVTHASSLIDTPWTRSPCVETPASIAVKIRKGLSIRWCILKTREPDPRWDPTSEYAWAWLLAPKLVEEDENIIANGGPPTDRVMLKDTTNESVDCASKSYLLETIALLPTLWAWQMVRLPPVVIETQGWSVTLYWLKISPILA